MSPLAPCTSEISHPSEVAEVSLPRTLATACAVVGVGVLPVVLVATLAVEARNDLGLDSGRLGLAVAGFWAGAAGSSTLAGRLVDRVGAGRVVHLAGGLIAAASMGIAAASSYGALVVFLALAGVGLALATPGISALVSRQLAPDRRGLALGVQQSGPPAATVVAGLALPAISEPLGWRASFVAAALVSLAAVATVRSEDCRAVPQAHEAPRASALWLAVGGGLAAAAASAGITFLVPFAAANGFSDGRAAAVLAGASAIAVAVRVGLGMRADGRPGDDMIVVSLLLAVGSVGFALITTAAIPAIVIGTVLGAGVGWGWAGLFVIVALDYRRNAPGAAVGSAIAGVYVGALAGPVVAGVVADASTPSAIWVLCSAASLSAAGVFLAEHRHSSARMRPVTGRP